MTEIEKKALALWNDERAWEGLPPWFLGDVEADAGFRAICRAIEELEAEKAARAAEREQHEAFRQEVSDVVEEVFDVCGEHIPCGTTAKLRRFIIAKPDPLVEALGELADRNLEARQAADTLRAAIEKRGGKIVWGGQVMDEFEARLEYLRTWWEEHGSRVYGSAEDWINSMTNVELLQALSWAKDDTYD